jgi:Uncharacterised nucleotidyltransferase
MGVTPRLGLRSIVSNQKPLQAARAADEFLAAMMRGEIPVWPLATGADFAHVLLVRATYHGVAALLFRNAQQAHSLAMSGGDADAIQVFIQACKKSARTHGMWELRHQELLAGVLEVLDAVGVQPVLFKGTALAYSLYAPDMVRTRGDTDFIVPADAMPRLEEALKRVHFIRELGQNGEHISYQATFTCSRETFEQHSLDVHWRINNSELLSHLFSYEELSARATALTALSPHALAASWVDALLIACMHRATHKQNPYYVDGVAHYGGDRLIWFYDIHLLLAALSNEDQTEFVRRAKDKGLSSVCLEGIALAQHYFSTPVAPDLLLALRHSAFNETELPAQYLNSGPLRQKWMDFWALRNLSERLTYVKELLMPPESYMRQKYVGRARAPLLALYVRRAITGLKKAATRVVSRPNF